MSYPPQDGPQQPGPQQPQGAPGQQPRYQQPGAGYQQPGYQQPGPGNQQPGYQPGPGQQYYQGAEDRQSAALAHLLGGIFSWLGALIMWIVSKDKSAYNDQEGKKALNFQIWVGIAYLGLSILYAIAASISAASITSTGTAGFGGLLTAVLWLAMFAIWVINVVLGIKNFNSVKNGGTSNYPIAAGLIK